MSSSNKYGKLIVIDGIDGTGKATQTNRLVERLRMEGKRVETLDFPQYENNVCGRILKKALRGEFGDFLALDPKVASAVYSADRRESLPLLREWLDEGAVVILDRYVSSNMIHQGGKITDEAEATSFLAWLDKLEHELMELPRPDIILYLDVRAEMARELLKQRALKEGSERDLVESDIDHMIASRDRALKIVSLFNTWKHIDCSDEKDCIRSFESIHNEVYALQKKI